MDLTDLNEPIDEESYDYMERSANLTPLLESIRSLVNGGATHDDIFNYVLRETGRVPLAHRCRQAARHIARNRKGASLVKNK